MQIFILLLIITFTIDNFYSVSGFWLIPDYWTTIYRSGHVERGRSSENFISFPESTNSYIGYWISSEKNYHEAYGNVFAELADDRGVKFCGIFADVYQNKSVKICGSFRVLSNKLNALPGKTPFEFVPISVAMINPDKAVEYLDWQIARYRTNSSEKWIFGSTNILQRIAYFPNNGEQLKKIDYKENKFKFLDNVQVLQRSATFDQRDLYENVPTLLTTTRRTITTTRPRTTTKTFRTSLMASTTTQVSEYEDDDYDKLPGAGIEWDALVEETPDSARQMEGDSGENSPCRISDAEKSPRKTLAEFFREDPFNETNDKEIEENAKLNKDCSVRDLSNEEIKELVGTLKDTNLRLNANKPREIVDHKKLKEKTSDDDVGKLRRLPKVRVNEIGQQSIYDQDIFNENQALSEEEIEEILQSNHLHSSRITIPSHEQQIVEQNFERMAKTYYQGTLISINYSLLCRHCQPMMMINKISHLILEVLYRLRQQMANKNSHLVLVDQQKHRQLDQQQHRQLYPKQHRQLYQHQLDQQQLRQLDQQQHRQLDQQQHRQLDQHHLRQLDQQQHRQLDQYHHHQLDQQQHRQLDQHQQRQLDQQQHRMSFNRLFRRRSFTDDEHQQQLTEDDYARWRRWKENEASFEMIVHTIRQRLDHWDNEVKTQKQIKISAQELGVRPPKREWDETRLDRIEHLRNEVRASSAALPMQASPSASSPLQASPSASSSLQASSSASHLHKGGQNCKILKYWKTMKSKQNAVNFKKTAKAQHAQKKACKRLGLLRTLKGGGPHTNRSLYSSAELIKNVEKKEDTKIMVTKKYDVASHGRTLEEAKENLIRYDQKMEELRRFERQFEVLSYTGSAEVLTEQQRIEKQYEKQYVAQKIVRQISTLNGALNCLYVNVSEMLQSGFTEEKKKLSKTFIDILRRVQRDEDETDDDVANLNNV
ncbi:hypothetical protein GPALN_004604 [Globodera pallida]|nr:hypothetical protein GPALN_004604 [Globodera pallida]